MQPTKQPAPTNKSGWGQRVAIGLSSLLLLVVVGAIAGGVAWYKHRQLAAAATAGPMPEIPEAISTAEVTPISFRRAASAVGSISAPRWITLRNETAGTLSAIHVQSGMIVEAGQILVELDTSIERPSLAAAEARKLLAQSTFQRSQQLFQSHATSDFQLEQSKAELAQATAEAERWQALIAKKTLLAPFRAKSGLINVYVGQYLSEGSEITTLQGLDDFVHVDFQLPQSVGAQMEVGKTVQVDHDGQQLVATIVAYDAKSDRMTRNKMIRAQLHRPPKNLMPNDSVKVHVEYGDEIHGQAVPMEAVRRTPMGAHVFVVETDDKGVLRAKSRPVTPGQAVGNRLVVLKGLEAHEHVVAEGSFKIRPGMAVREIGNTVAEHTPSTQPEPAAAKTPPPATVPVERVDQSRTPATEATR